jgi:predicted secreted Zn-dependent protease
VAVAVADDPGPLLGLRPDTPGFDTFFSRADGAARGRLLLHLQRTQGNQFVQRVIQHQRTGQRSASPQAQVADSRGAGAPTDLATRIQTASQGGTTLPPDVQQQLAPVVGGDLSQVRVHTDGEADRLARAVDAVAFTTGPNVFFRAGAYDPASASGKRLLAHEAAHTLQQAAGPVAGAPVTDGVALSDPGDPFERAAQVAAEAAVAGGMGAAGAPPPPMGPPPSRSAWGVQRQAIHHEREHDRRAPEPGAALRSTTLMLQRSPDGDSAGAMPDAADTSGADAQPQGGTSSASGGSGGTTTITVGRATYAVTAKTLKAAAAQIQQRTEAGETTWKPTYRVTTDDQGKITDATVDMPVTVTMPNWPDAATLPSKDKAKWDAFVQALEAHEQGHVTLVRQKLGDVAKTLVGKTKTEADAAFKAALTDLQTASDEYDTETDHGRNEGCVIVTDEDAENAAGETSGAGPLGEEQERGASGAAMASAEPATESATEAAGTEAAWSPPVVQAATAAVVQRWTMPLLTTKSNEELIRDGVAGDVTAIKEISDFSSVSADDKLTMIGHLIAQGWVGPRDERALETLWGGLGTGTMAQHLELWTKSVSRDSDLKNLPEIKKLRTNFPADVKALAGGYLLQNHQVVLGELLRLGGPLAVGPLADAPNQPDPTEAEAEELRKLQEAAASVAKLQKAQEAAHQIVVGYNCTMGDTGNIWDPAQFDPYKPPDRATAPESDLANVVVHARGEIKPYKEVKDKWDEADEKIKGLITLHPDLYAISREGKSATTAAFANLTTPAQARRALLQDLRQLLRDIEGSQQKLDSGQLDPLDLIPVHAQLLQGKAAASGTKWSEALEAWAARDLTKEHNLDRALTALALETAAAVLFLIAPFTGGASLFVMLAGAAALGVKAKMSTERYEALAEASKTSVLPKTELVTQPQVDEAQMVKDADQIAFALAVLALGTAAAGEALGAIKGPKPVEGETPAGQGKSAGAAHVDDPAFTTNWSYKSKPTFGHTFETHGAGPKNFKRLQGRAGGTGQAQGQWLDNEEAAQFLAAQRPYLDDVPPGGYRDVPIPPGLGQIIPPKGDPVPATTARLCPSGVGYTSAFPIP